MYGIFCLKARISATSFWLIHFWVCEYIKLVARVWKSRSKWAGKYRYCSFWKIRRDYRKINRYNIFVIKCFTEVFRTLFSTRKNYNAGIFFKTTFSLPSSSYSSSGWEHCFKKPLSASTSYTFFMVVTPLFAVFIDKWILPQKVCTFKRSGDLR